jgi:hypothetical protein
LHNIPGIFFLVPFKAKTGAAFPRRGKHRGIVSGGTAGTASGRKAGRGVLAGGLKGRGYPVVRFIHIAPFPFIHVYLPPVGKGVLNPTLLHPEVLRIKIKTGSPYRRGNRRASHGKIDRSPGGRIHFGPNPAGLKIQVYLLAVLVPDYFFQA